LGLSWVIVDTVQNLMHCGLFLGATSPDVISASNRVTDAIWHAGHFGGGLWVTMVAATSGAFFSKAYRSYSVIAGTIFMLHPFVFPVAALWFNLEFLLVPIWALWTAISNRTMPRVGLNAAALAPAGVRSKTEGTLRSER
jgi:hypothetical protein